MKIFVIIFCLMMILITGGCLPQDWKSSPSKETIYIQNTVSSLKDLPNEQLAQVIDDLYKTSMESELFNERAMLNSEIAVYQNELIIRMLKNRE